MIIALDPGLTTGVAIASSESTPWVIRLLQLGPAEHHRALLSLLQKNKPSTIVCETFQNRGQDSVVLASVEYIGIVKLYAQLTDCKVVWQSSATGKAFWKDPRLQEHGLYLRGLRHARDATRHYCYWRTFTCKDQSLLKGEVMGQVMAD